MIAVGTATTTVVAAAVAAATVQFRHPQPDGTSTVSGLGSARRVCGSGTDLHLVAGLERAERRAGHPAHRVARLRDLR